MYKNDLEGIQQHIHTYILLRSNPATIPLNFITDRIGFIQ